MKPIKYFLTLFFFALFFGLAGNYSHMADKQTVKNVTGVIMAGILTYCLSLSDNEVNKAKDKGK